MAKIRKLNVSEITGTSPYTGDTDAVMPSGTVVVYEKDNNGVIEHVLRVHDGVTNGGIALGAGEGPVIFNGSNGIVRNNLNEGIAALFNNGDVYITGGESLRFTGLSQFEGESTAMLRFWDNEGRHSTGNDPTELVTLNVGNDAFEGDPTEGFFKIVTEKETGSVKEWKFDSDGVLHLPASGDIVDSTGASVLGGGGANPNIWIQTFAAQDGFPSDVVSLATSVEYDNAGNIIALFSHQTGIGDFNIPSGSYFSVAKFTAAGLKLWQVRLAAGMGTDVYTDGWGLAVDNVDGRIYVAGRVTIEGSYNKSSLIKLNSEDGSLIWSNVYDFGDRSDSPVVDVDSDGNPVMVGYFSTDVEDNDGITITKISKLDGSILWSQLLDGQGDDEAYGMAVGPNGETVAVGYTSQIGVTDAADGLYADLAGNLLWTIGGSINSNGVTADFTFTDGFPTFTNIVDTVGGRTIDDIIATIPGSAIISGGSNAVFDISVSGASPLESIILSDLATATATGTMVKNADNIVTPGGWGNWLVFPDSSLRSTLEGLFTMNQVVPVTWNTGSTSPTGYVTIQFPGDGTFQITPVQADGSEAVAGTWYFPMTFNGSSSYSVSVTNGGTNYQIGHRIKVLGSALGGADETNDAIITVDTVTGGVIDTVTITGTATSTAATYTGVTGTNYTDNTDDMVVKVETVAAGEPDDRMLVVKYDSTGTIAWQKAIQFDAGYACRGADADIDSQGNVYVCGSYDYAGDGDTNSAMNLVKFDSSGVKQWSRRVAGPCEDFATSIVVGPDDTLYLSGVTGSLVNDTPRYVWVVAKYTTSGTVVWQRLIENTTGWTFGGVGFLNNGGGSNLAVGEGYVALGGGFGEPFFGISSATVLQIDTDGTVFNVGDWEFKAASFSGTLNSDASDITVVDAGKVDSAITGITVDDTLFDTDTTNFLIPTLYSASGAGSELTNGEYTFALGNTGTVTLPAGGTITEGVVTSNPTIQLTPATPTAPSQKLVIKGGAQFSAEDNGIFLTWSEINPQVSDTINIVVVANAYTSQTIYWWINPAEAGIADPGFGTVEIDGNGNGSFTFTVDSDDYEFTVRVSPENNNYDPASIGVETLVFNAAAPVYGDHHLHLTTGDLTETSIIVGTDDHNVRTTVDGGVEINTYLYPSGGGSAKWTFDNSGNLTLPNDAVIRTDGSNVEVGGVANFNVEASGVVNIYTNTNGVAPHQWQFGDDGRITFPDATVQTTAFTGSNLVNGVYTVTLDNDGQFNINNIASYTVATVTQEAGEVGNPNGGMAIISAQTAYSPDVVLIQPGWTVTGLGITALTTVTSVTETSPGLWEIVTDTEEIGPFLYDEVYTFTETTVSGYTFDGTTLTIPNGATLESFFNGPGAPVTALTLNSPEGGGAQVNLVVDNNTISVNNNGITIDVGSDNWQFGSTGLQFPDASVQTTAYVAPTIGNSAISSQDSGTFITRNGMTIGITSAGILQMTFDSVIDIKGRIAINGGASTVISGPNGTTTIGVAYPISGATTEDDHVVATIVDSSFHHVYRVTAIIREQGTTPGSEFTTAYAIIEQLQ